ncbi:hypothetical protein LOC68_08660 [Blastopirellula sp. JC732]|uniref:Uncharacterized protein n=1 Tax=Blastopirellula sediminis TaxID=2894196 RepID=A0A9X1MKL4_9BACT|nr:hypothetical protein [Blastopirellula sediminis]MCC9608759.1 hypothetical protein [Blastopirellula sediminis]MCC9628464.1 hypothetical protein [Blastopirellula sediminis]
MRVLAAFVAAALALFLVKAYLTLNQPTAGAAPHVETLETAAGTFRLEVELSFDAGPDRFASDLNNSNSLSIRFAGDVLFQTDKPVAAGQKIEVADIGDVVHGRNEFLIEATPQNPGPPLFAKISIYSSELQEPIAERFVWAPAGSTLLSGVANFATTEPPVAGEKR